MSKHYRVNEIFYTLQGEGIRAGTPNVFVRFSGCNLQCRVEPGPLSPGGFDCDTEFASGTDMTAQEIAEAVCAFPQLAEHDAVTTRGGYSRAVVLSGGEPGLQVDRDLIDALHLQGCYLAIETNGSIELPEGLDWITVSPKVAEHAIRQLSASEVKYVRHQGQGIPRPRCIAKYKLISPAFTGAGLNREDLAWCIQLVKDNPSWRLSVQQHKAWGIR